MIAPHPRQLRQAALFWCTDAGIEFLAGCLSSSNHFGALP